MKTKTAIGINQNNLFRYAVATVVILMIPALGKWNWGKFDYAVIATLLIGTGIAFELISNRIKNRTHRIVIGFALLLALILLVAELAVGIFGSPIAGS